MTRNINEKSIVKGKSLKNNTLWNIIGNIIYSLTQWGLVILLAKISTAEMVGIFTLGLALTAPLLLFLRFNLRMAVATDITNNFKYDEYFTFRIYTSVIFLFSMILVTILYPTDIYTMAVILSLSVGKVFESVSDIIYADWQKKERFDFIAKSRIIKGLSSLFIFGLTMFITKDLLLSTISLSLSWLITLLVYDSRIFMKFNKVKFYFNFENQKKIFILALPLGIAQLIASLNSNIPRYFIEYFYNIEMLGIYSALIYIIVAGGNFMLTVSSVLITPLAKYYNENKIRDFIKILITPVLLTLFGGIIAIIITYLYGEWILIIIYSSEYAIFNNVFSLMVIMGIIKYMSIFLDAGITSTRKFNLLPKINIITMITIILGGSILIIQYGLIGAVYTLIIAEVIQLLIRITILTRLLLYKSNEEV